MASRIFKKVYLNDYFTVVGPLEKESHLKRLDLAMNDYYYGCKTFEQAEIKMQIDMPLYTPPSNGLTLTGDLAYHLTKFFTREYWDFRNKRNIKKTLEVLKNYDTVMPDSLQSEK